MALNRPIIQAIINQDSEPVRFEHVCVALLSKLEGAVVVPTSASWDMGRDGRSVGPGPKLFACCTLRDDLEDKSEQDLKALTRGVTKPDKVYFCSSQFISEHRQNAVKEAMLKLLPKRSEVDTLGAKQLVELGVRYPEIIESAYRSEIELCINALKTDDATMGTEQDASLRLALITAGHDNSTAIREEVYRITILSALTKGAVGLGNCCKEVAAVMALAQSLPEEAVKPHLNRLDEDGLIRELDGVYSITDDGRRFLEEQRAKAPMTLMEGRTAIRMRLEKSFGHRLADEQFDTIWRVLQDKLAWMFYERGLRLMEEVADLIGIEVENPVSARPAPDFIKELATAVGSTSALPDQQAELALAIEDIFSERQGHAADWLGRVCAGFVIACSLGLEAITKDAIEGIAVKTVLVFDTDVVLSLLCEGEPDHDAALTIQKRWKALGGKMMVADSVAHEVSYHASIANNDYEGVKSWLPGSEDERLRLIENAFVRSFATLFAKKKVAREHWGRYIKQYRPEAEGEFRKISSTLLSDFGIARLPERAASEKVLEGNAREFLYDRIDRERLSTYERRNARDKARRDASMYAAMISHLRTMKETDPAASCLLVSSARRLMALEAKYGQSDENHFVVPPSIVVYLLSLMPDVTLSMSALKAFLFDGNRITFSSDLERTVLRVVHDSSEMSIPWARRGTLMRELRDKMFERAKQEGVPREERSAAVKAMAAQIGNEKHRARSAELIKNALDSVAADTRQEAQLTELRRKNLQLEAEVARLKEQKRRGK